MRTYGYDAVKLSEAYSLEELAELRRRIVDDPANANLDGGLWLYTKAARRKLDAIGYAVYFKLKEKAASEVPF